MYALTLAYMGSSLLSLSFEKKDSKKEKMDFSFFSFFWEKKENATRDRDFSFPCLRKKTEERKRKSPLCEEREKEREMRFSFSLTPLSPLSFLLFLFSFFPFFLFLSFSLTLVSFFETSLEAKVNGRVCRTYIIKKIDTMYQIPHESSWSNWNNVSIFSRAFFGA